MSCAPSAKAFDRIRLKVASFHQNLPNFSKEISLFKDQKVEIVTGVMIAPDLATFLTQADEQGFKPKMISVGKAALFPSAVDALGSLGDGLTAEIRWSSNHPFKSSLTGASSKDLAATYTKSTDKQWTEPVGYNHSLFEVAVDALSRTKDIGDRTSILAAIKATNLTTIVGPVAFPGNPVPNVAKAPLVRGQWGKGKDFPFDLTITYSASDYIPVAGKTHTYR
jgi:branched-chain amino acid transport system substrate-binding protein